ncbi:hypothetical protein C8J57DRAFT_1459316 [Mycena rebaudengoi]|nr:hypothetical protein C8J57DRAFT_1459316 [Mycena rebaudengoi]
MAAICGMSEYLDPPLRSRRRRGTHPHLLGRERIVPGLRHRWIQGETPHHPTAAAAETIDLSGCTSPSPILLSIVIRRGAWVAAGSSIGASTSRETYTLRRRRGEAAGRRRRCSLILTCLLASCTLDARRSDVAVWALCARASANTVRARVGYRAPTALKYVSAGVLPIRAGGRFGVGSGPSSTRLVVRKAARRDRRCFRLAGGPLASATSTCLAAGGGERDHRYCIWRRVLVFGGAGRVPRRSFSWRDTRERVGAEDGAHRVLSCGGGAGGSVSPTRMARIATCRGYPDTPKPPASSFQADDLVTF